MDSSVEAMATTSTTGPEGGGVFSSPVSPSASTEGDDGARDGTVFHMSPHDQSGYLLSPRRPNSSRMPTSGTRRNSADMASPPARSIVRDTNGPLFY